MAKLFYLQVLTLLLTLSACNGSGEKQTQNVTPLSCHSQAEKNQYLWQILNEHYLWQEQLDQQTQVANFSSLQTLLGDVTKKNPIDRFSFIQTNDGIDFQQLILEGVGISYGMDYQIPPDNSALVITQVFNQGSAAELGLKRGDKITHIAGKSIAKAVADTTLNTEQFNSKRIAGHKVEIQWQNAHGLHSGTLEHRQIKVNTVTHQQIIHTEHHKIGYLVFYLFTATAAEELNQSFAHFAQAQVDRLIIDLRYNGGGCCLDSPLESQIAGENVLGKLAGRFFHNSKQSQKNSQEYFTLEPGAPTLNMDQVIFLTSGATASASEATINKLKPYIDVKLVGQRTYGKPVGSASFNICGETAFLTTARSENAHGVGDYFDGLAVDCVAEDKVAGDWGDRSDPLLSEALFLLEHGHCSI